MKYYLSRIVLFISLTCLSSLAEPKASDRPITIKAVEGLQFSPVRAKLQPGQKVLFRILNRDPNDQPHNFVIIKAGSLLDIQKASMQITSDSEKSHFVPDHPAVLKSTKVLKADQSEEFYFTAPDEPGVYQYVCTYPGHSTMMYGALYVGTTYESIEQDQNIPPVARVAKAKPASDASFRPYFRRFFIEGMGPAAIGVALEGDINYAWDAGNCRLRKAWTGAYLDFGRNASSNGSKQARILGDVFWDGGGDELTYSIRIQGEDEKPSFKGYNIVNGLPQFKYDIAGMEVIESITASSDALIVNLTISGAQKNLALYAKGAVTSNVGKRKGDYILVPANLASKITLTIPVK